MRGSYVGGWLLGDEISMCVLPVVAALDQLRLGGTKICTFGDWEQLPPVGNSWRGHPVDAQAFRESRLYKRWSDCTMFKLTRCRRSDEAHYKFYTGLGQNLPRAITASQARFGEAEDADLHVCISHRRRRAIAHAKQKRLAVGRECVEVPAGNDPAFDCFVGTKLVGNSSTVGKIVNGGRYTVTAIGKEKLSLVDDMTEDAFETSPEACGKCCLLAHAMVYNKVQGSTESGRTVMLHDTSSKYFRRCHLYVGLSRVTDGSNVFVARD
jgi:hypothetical protein